MNGGVDHIAIRVPSLDAAIETFVDGLGFEVTHKETDRPDGARFAYLQLGHWEFEVYEDTKQEAAFVHMGLLVDDLADSRKELEARGFGVADTIEGSRGSKLAFLNPATTGGLAIHITTR